MLERKIVVNTRLEVANIIARAKLKNSLTIIVKILTRKRDVKLKIGFRLESILLLLINRRDIQIIGKTYTAPINPEATKPATKAPSSALKAKGLEANSAKLRILMSGYSRTLSRDLADALLEMYPAIFGLKE